MTGPVRARLDEIEAALAKATPGPWLYDPEYDSFSVWAGDPDRPHIIADTRLINGVGAENAALIVAAVNALPELLAEVRRQADALDAVRALLPTARDRVQEQIAATIEAMSDDGPAYDEVSTRLLDLADEYEKDGNQVYASRGHFEPPSTEDGVSL